MKTNNNDDPILSPTDMESGLIGKTLKLDKIEGRRRRGDRGRDGWMVALTRWA